MADDLNTLQGLLDDCCEANAAYVAWQDLAVPAMRNVVGILVEVRNSTQIGLEYTVEDNSRRHYRWTVGRLDAAITALKEALGE